MWSKLCLFIVVLFFLVQTCFADIITLKNGESIEGKIIDIDSKQILFKAKVEDDVMVCSFDKSEIARIKLKPFKLPVKITIFDKLNLRKKESYLGLVKLEMPEAIYFSLLLKRGLGIVRFSRENIVGIEGTYGIRKMLAKLYFQWRKFIYYLRRFILKVIRGKKIIAVTDKDLPQLLKELDEKERSENVKKIMEKLNKGELTDEVATEKIRVAMAKRTIYSPGAFKREFKDYLSMDKNKLYELGIRQKCLILGMGYNQVKAVLGNSYDVKHKDGKEYWHYSNGNVAIFKDEKLIGYTKEIPNLESAIRHYFPEVMLQK